MDAAIRGGYALRILSINNIDFTPPPRDESLFLVLGSLSMIFLQYFTKKRDQNMLKLVFSKNAATTNFQELRQQTFLAFNGLNAFYGGSNQDYRAIKENKSFPVTIDFNTANRHIAVLGGSGTGKSSGVLRPAALRLLESGCSGIILDWKGDFHNLYKFYPNRIYFINPDIDGPCINLLGGMSENEILTFLSTVKTRNKHQPYFGSKANSIIRFVIRTFFLLNKPVTLASIYRALASPRSDFAVFFDRLLDRYDLGCLPRDYRAMIRAQYSDPFSILKIGGSKHLQKYESRSEVAVKKSSHSSDAANQFEWQVGCIKAALEPFESEERVRTSLCAEITTDDLDLENLIYKDRKTLVIHIKPDRYGNAAPIVNRLLRTRLIAAMKSAAPDLLDESGGLGREWYTFMLADEYQNTCMLKSSDNESFYYDDLSWFSEAREFGHINIIGMQGVSSLLSACGNEKSKAVSTLLLNAATLISFASCDTETLDEIASRVPSMQKEEVTSHVSSSLPTGTAIVVCHFAGTQGAFKVSTDAGHYGAWMQLQDKWLSKSNLLISSSKIKELSPAEMHKKLVEADERKRKELEIDIPF